MGLDVYLHETIADDAVVECGTCQGKKTKARDDGSTYECYRCDGTGVAKARGEGDDKRTRCIEIDSKLYPEHYWKIGYFRSSYNESGFNRVVPARVGEGGSIYEIMGHEGEEYEQAPDWAASKDRALAVRSRYLEALKRSEYEGKTTYIEEHRPNPFINPASCPASASDAMEGFLAQLERWKKEPKEPGGDMFSEYANGFGHFCRKPARVLAFIQGQGCLYVVRLGSESAEEDYYLKALDIIIETCEWVLAQPGDISRYLLHWSG